MSVHPDGNEAVADRIDGLVRRLSDDPADDSAGLELAELLGGLDEPERQAWLNGVQDLLAGQPRALGAVAAGLYAQSWTGCELASTHFSLASLRLDHGNDRAIQLIGESLKYVGELDRLLPVIEEALGLTDRNPTLLWRWAEKQAMLGAGELAAALAAEAAERLLERLEHEPDDGAAMETFAAVLGLVPVDQRVAMLDRVQEIAAPKADSLTMVGDALLRQDWPGCQEASVVVLLAALHINSASPRATRALASALGRLPDSERSRALADEGLALTDRHPSLLTSWARWSSALALPEAENLAAEALEKDLATLADGEVDPATFGRMSSDLGLIPEERRAPVLDRAGSALAVRPASLCALGQALVNDSWHGCEQASVRFFIAALQLDPRTEGAARGVAFALSYLDGDLNEVRPLVERALDTTGHEPEILTAWTRWLIDHGHAALAAPLARELADRTLDTLVAEPDDDAAEEFARALGLVSPADRPPLVDRAEAAFTRQTGALTTVGRALFLQSWRGCEKLSTHFFLAALRVDQSSAEARSGIVDALRYLENGAEDARPVVEEALALTGREPEIVAAWARWLVDRGRPEEATPLALEVVERALEQLGADPDDDMATQAFATSLGQVPERERGLFLDRAEAVLQADTTRLGRLGASLSRASWMGSRWVGVRFLIAALERAPDNRPCVEALEEVLRFGEAPPDTPLTLIEAALSRTGRRPELLVTWSRWIADHRTRDEGAALAGEAADMALHALDANPADLDATTTLAAALTMLDANDQGRLLDRASDLLNGLAGPLKALGDALSEPDRPATWWASASFYLAALKIDPDDRPAAVGVARALCSHGDPREDRRPTAEAALELTGRAAEILAAWAHCLYDRGEATTAAGLAVEAAERSLALLQTDPDDSWALDALALAIAVVPVEGRSALLDRAEVVLAGRAQQLASLATAFATQPWSGLRWTSTRFYLAALRANALTDSALSGLAKELRRSTAAICEIEPVVDEALDLTGRAIALVAAWITRLAADGLDGRVHPLALEAANHALDVLEDWPDDVAARETLAEMLRAVADDERPSLLDRTESILSRRAGMLTTMGDAVRQTPWAERERVSQRFYLAALRLDNEDRNAEIGIANALLEDNGPRARWERAIAEAFRLTGRAPDIGAAWASRLLASESPKEAAVLGTEAAERCLELLAKSPDDALARTALALALPAVPESERPALLDRAKIALSDRAAALCGFGHGLLRYPWSGSDWTAVRYFLSVLRLDAATDAVSTEVAKEAVSGVAQVLTNHAEGLNYEQKALIEEALALRSEDPVLLSAWACWLSGHDRRDDAAPLAGRAVRRSVERLAAAPADAETHGALAAALRLVPGDLRQSVLEHAEASLAGRSTDLFELGRALYWEDWDGSEAASTALFTAALRLDPHNTDIVASLGDALGQLDGRAETAAARPAVEEALTMTGRSPELLRPWARALFKAGEFARAEDVTLDCIREGADDDGVSSDITDDYSTRRQSAMLRRWLSRLEVVAPHDPQIPLGRAGLFRLHEQPQRAVPLLSRLATTEELDDVVRFQALGDLLFNLSDLRRQDRFDEIMASVETQQTLWTNPTFGKSATLALRARAALLRKDPVAAERYLTQALEGRSHEESLTFRPERLALRALQGGPLDLGAGTETTVVDLREATSYLTDAVHSLPLRQAAVDHPSAADGDSDPRPALYFELGLDLGALERYGDAVEAYYNARVYWSEPVQSESFWLYGPYALHNVASIFEDEGKHADAKRLWGDVLNEYQRPGADDDPSVCWARSTVALRLGDLEEAYASCRRGLECDPDHPDLLSRLVEIESTWRSSQARVRGVGSGASAVESANPLRAPEASIRWRSRDAARVYRAHLEERAAESENPDHHAELGRFLLQRSDVGAARRYIVKAAHGDPESVGKRTLLAELHEARGEYARAVAELSVALERAPEDYDVRYRLGQAHARLGHRDEAAALFVDTLDRAPAHIETIVALADVRLELADRTNDTGLYIEAVTGYTTALKLDRDGLGSKFLSSAEAASIFYQRGYSRVKLYEAKPAPIANRKLLDSARKDFEACLAIDPSHHRARHAHGVLAENKPSVLTGLREKVAPWVIVALAAITLAVSLIGWFRGDLGEASLIAMAFGSVAIAIAGFYLPEILKLKIAGVELEKSPVEQTRQTVSFDIKR